MKLLAILVLLAIGSTTAHAQATQAEGFVDFTVGSEIICGLRADGSVKCSTTPRYPRYDFPENFPAMSDIDAGSTHACGVDLQGSVRCWGDNVFGQLNAPTDVNNFVSVSASSGFHSCGITDANQIICWGLDTNGQSSPPNEGFGYTEVYTDYQKSCGLRTDGDIECWGGQSPTDPSRVFDDGPYSQYITERRGNCAILEDGEFVCGDGSSGIMTDRYTDVTFSYPYICGLRIEGQLECIQEPGTPTINNPIDDTAGTFTRIQNTPNSICALNTDGVIQCWTTGSSLALLPPGQERLLAEPVNVSVSAYSDSTVEISWERIRDRNSFYTSGYEVFRDDALLAFTDGVSYVDDSLSPGIDYQYSVRALGFDGAISQFSESVTINTSNRGGNTPEGSGYSVPERSAEPSSAEIFAYSDTLNEVVWNRPVSSEIQGYEIRRNGSYVGYTQGISYLDSTVSSGNCYRYDILPVHSDGHILGLLSVSQNSGDESGCQ